MMIDEFYNLLIIKFLQNTNLIAIGFLMVKIEKY
jgi:hypothetical protein